MALKQLKLTSMCSSVIRQETGSAARKRTSVCSNASPHRGKLGTKRMSVTQLASAAAAFIKNFSGTYDVAVEAPGRYVTALMLFLAVPQLVLFAA